MSAAATERDEHPTLSCGVPLWRRLAAACYDGFVVLALCFIGTALVMPLSHGAISPAHPLAELLYRLYLLAIGYGFFAGFWIRDGQTVGMLAWRVKLVSSRDQGAVSGWQALLRYLAAILSWAALGLGFWWALFDPERKTWHDRFSGTELMQAAQVTAASPKS
jgi:uncharacterized RDD family membrane protein YckC